MTVKNIYEVIDRQSFGSVYVWTQSIPITGAVFSVGIIGCCVLAIISQCAHIVFSQLGKGFKKNVERNWDNISDYSFLIKNNLWNILSLGTINCSLMIMRFYNLF